MGKYFTLEDEAKEQFYKIPKIFMEFKKTAL